MMGWAVYTVIAGLRFRGRRADYYEYLAALMEQGEGRKTLHDIFDDDARRYGTRTVRGYLSSVWVHRYRESGGDLRETFAGTLPQDDIALLGSAQSSGAGALPAALRDLAATVRLLDRARSAFVATMAAALAACAVVGVMLFATPFYTVPTLQRVFQVVPPEYWGGRTSGLFGLAALLEAYMPVTLAALVFMLAALTSTLPSFTGRARQMLDDWLVWRSYRDFQGIRFLSLLAIMVRQRGNVGMSLRNALLAQVPGASPWKNWHLQKMLVRLDDGVVGADTFHTGLLDNETRWFLSDMLAIHGVDAGLTRTRHYIESRVITDVLRRALVLRWVLLLAALATLLGMALWHYSVVDELRRSMQAYYAVH